MCRGLPWGEAQRSVLVAREIKKTKAGGTGDGLGNQSGGGPRENEYCSMLPSGGGYRHLQDQEERSIWVGPRMGLLAMASSEVTCFFWSQPHRHCVEDLEPLVISASALPPQPFILSISLQRKHCGMP